jgi:xylulokinase
MTGSVLIGIDIGTSAVKAVMTAPGGERLDGFSARHPMHRPGPGAAEQDPADWMRLLGDALARFAAHPRAGEVAAIGVTSQVNTHVFCDADGEALRPALTWQDTRPGPDGAALDACIDVEAKIAALGAPIPIDASHALSRMAWLARTAPDLWARTRAVMLPKDFAIARLTGEAVADPLSAVGLVGTDLRYAAPVLALVPGADRLLPPLRDPLAIAGHVRPGWPFAGVPVATGTMDAWASMFGLGVADEGEAMYLSGTSEVMGLVSQARRGELGVITFPDWRGITLHAGPTQAGGASLDWVCRLLGRDLADLEALAATATIRPDSSLFLPHLEGERAPLWDAQSRGAFAGLSSSTDAGVLVASVMEGVAFSARLALEAVERSGGVRVARLKLGGGGAASAVWNRIRADALGRPLVKIAAPEAGASGALVMAGVASGLQGDLVAATRALVTTDGQFDPDPARAAIADDRFARYRDLYGALRPLHHALVAAGS